MGNPERTPPRPSTPPNLALATGAGDDAIDAALAAAGGDAKVALVSLLAGIGADAARERLADAGGNVDAALRA